MSNEKELYHAIAAPKRRQMLDLLREKDQSVSELASHFQVSQPAISQHLKVLKDSGLVSEERQGRQRIYRLNPQALLPIFSWLEQYQEFWDDKLENLGDYLKEKHG